MDGEPSNSKETRGDEKDSKQQQQQEKTAVNIEASNYKIMQNKITILVRKEDKANTVEKGILCHFSTV